MLMIFKNNFTLTGIYENRKKGFFKAFIYLSLFTTLIYFPLGWDWYNKTTLNYENYGINFVSQPPEWIDDGLPDCYFENQQFFCNEETQPLYYNDYEILFLDATPSTDKYIIFKKDQFKVVDNTTLEFTYSDVEDMRFSDLETKDSNQSAQIIADLMFVSVKNNLFVPALLALYAVFILMNFIYLLMLAAISMSFKFKTSKFPKFKEVLSMYMFSVTYPSLFALFITLVTQSFAFTPVLMNFLTPVIMYLVYRKNILKS